MIDNMKQKSDGIIDKRKLFAYSTVSIEYNRNTYSILFNRTGLVSENLKEMENII